MTQNKDYKTAYEAVEKIMMFLRERNYSLSLENLNLKKRLEAYEPVDHPKEQEFIGAITKIMEV